MSMIIDRRLNDKNKSATNRERFIRRYKDQVKRAIDGMVSDRSIKDMEKGGDVRIPVKDISEPAFRHGHGGDREIVHPGNKEFNQGDRVQRPESGAQRGAHPVRPVRCLHGPHTRGQHGPHPGRLGSEHDDDRHGAAVDERAERARDQRLALQLDERLRSAHPAPRAGGQQEPRRGQHRTSGSPR